MTRTDDDERLPDDERPEWLNMGALRDEKLDSLFLGFKIGLTINFIILVAVLVLT